MNMHSSYIRGFDCTTSYQASILVEKDYCCHNDPLNQALFADNQPKVQEKQAG
jgi:hypothetical protein